MRAGLTAVRLSSLPFYGPHIRFKHDCVIGVEYGVLNILRGKAEGVPDLNLDPSILFTVANLNNRVR